MSLMNKAKAVYVEWTGLFEEVKKTLPEIGLTLNVEKDGVQPVFIHNSEQDLLYATASISQQIVHNDGTLCPPRWVLLGKDRSVKWPLKVIITGPSKNLYIAYKEECVVLGIKITGHSQTKKSVIGELVL